MVGKFDNSEYWEWVVSRKAYDNPRGDFIRDSRDVIQMKALRHFQPHQKQERSMKSYSDNGKNSAVFYDLNLGKL